MAKNPWEFLDGWARENVHATVFDDTATAARLAINCMDAADAAGINRQSLIKASGNNVARFMLERLNEAANGEVNRLVSKDKT